MTLTQEIAPYLEIASVIAGQNAPVIAELERSLGDRGCMDGLFSQSYCDIRSLSDSEYAWFVLTYLLEQHALLVQLTPTTDVSDAEEKLRTLPLLADIPNLPSFGDYGADDDDCIDEWLTLYNDGLEEYGCTLVELVENSTEEINLACVSISAVNRLTRIACSIGEEIAPYE